MNSNITVTYDEMERQATIMALAHLAVERPGFRWMLSQIALKMDNAVTPDEPELFGRLLALHRDRVDRGSQGIEQDAAELQAGFDLRWAADMRAIKRWQEATGRHETWPDHADLVVWLMEQLDKR